jgi:DNA-binding NarL/FixJ family response regulator
MPASTETQTASLLLPSQQAAPSATPPPRPLRTYLVEDSSVIRDNLIELLMETIPLELVGSAEDETSATQWLREHRGEYDLVIIDIFLKAGSGLGALALNREHDGQANWIVLSNHATAEMRSKCIEMGANAVFDKSNEIEALLLYCKKLMGLDVIADAPNSLIAALD